MASLQREFLQFCVSLRRSYTGEQASTLHQFHRTVGIMHVNREFLHTVPAMKEVPEEEASTSYSAASASRTRGDSFFVCKDKYLRTRCPVKDVI
ncbi:hypothetical protein CDAR_569681 [Caerostris darwini]|uniref:Uncharacterized protein n=1 Tax=Caerostris darwini TaxID=1538125 RepID=A0AAV4S1F1_9ARAC|nr:hypothetical protein CDAR_569681 [Caerostris darwini]